MTKYLYVSLAVQPWSAVDIEGPLPTKIGPMTTKGCVGFLPVMNKDWLPVNGRGRE